jgi:hypothetical protein
MVASSWFAGIDLGVVSAYRHVLGGLNADAHLIALDGNQHDRYILADSDCFIDAAC